MIRHDVSLLTDFDLHLFNEGNHAHLYQKLGAHPMEVKGEKGTLFSVWAPDAEKVAVMGDFNGWSKSRHPLHSRGQSGIWEGFIPKVGSGAHYKFYVQSRHLGYKVDKADPFAFFNQTPPETASVVWDLDYTWGDGEWMKDRRKKNDLHSPISIYEVHFGSWARVPAEGNRSLTYREMAPRLADYVLQTGFTHVEFLPLMEHPFYGSWGYQMTGYFSPTSRYGTPQDLMYLIDYLHQRGIGVILDWVPSHFPSDEHGLAYFDGTHMFEHSDPRQRVQPDWETYTFNYGRHEVRSYLLSSGIFWLDAYHADGLRVDAVASMLYLDYSRREGEWIPNEYGGRENLPAIHFLRKLNAEVYGNYPDVQTFAEESTSWPMVSRPTYLGGLGFGMKWDMGWMHDTLLYMRHDPIHRKYHHNQLTFRMLYAYTENFTLPLSHDEVVHGKGSLLGKMPGDDWQKFANLRAMLGYMFTQPAKKLLFQGGEIGQWDEWSHERSVDWHLLEYEPHQGVLKWVSDLNRAYRNEPALHELDLDPSGFEWIDCSDAEGSVVVFLRRGKNPSDVVLVACNFTPVPRPGYRVGVPCDGMWREILNSDSTVYGGSGWGNLGGLAAAPTPMHGRPWSLGLVLPPLAVTVFKHEG
jgi:1,4-alpha-glucan branching enzyme